MQTRIKLAVGLYAVALISGGAVNAQDSNSQVFCNRENTISITEFTKPTAPNGYSDLQVYEIDSDFRNPKKMIFLGQA